MKCKIPERGNKKLKKKLRLKKKKETETKIKFSFSTTLSKFYVKTYVKDGDVTYTNRKKNYRHLFVDIRSCLFEQI